MERFTKNHTNVIDKIKKLRNQIECISPTYSCRDNWLYYEFRITLKGNRRPLYIYSNTIKLYDSDRRDIRVPVKFFGIIIYHKTKIEYLQRELLTNEEYEKAKEKEVSFLEKTREEILSLFKENERDEIDREYEGCLESQHLWEKWHYYSGHNQRLCLKCGEKQGIGTVDGQPLSQRYIDSLSCGYF